MKALLMTLVFILINLNYTFQPDNIHNGFFVQAEGADLGALNPDTLTKADAFLFGIDISHYQRQINWSDLSTEKHITFVVVRATMGGSRKDKFFRANFDSAKKYFIVGAYHYYDPNEHSSLQAKNFISTVKLDSGNLRPVLDIERLSTNQSISSLRVSLKNWLKLVEKHYGVKPIIYTGLGYYCRHLDGHFNGYPLWVATHNPKMRGDTTLVADIHQFSVKERVCGINSCVDGKELHSRNLERVLIR